MIEVRDLNIDDLLAVCRKLPQSERDAYTALTGIHYVPEDVAIDTFRQTAFGWILEDPVKPVVACGMFRIRPGVFVTWFYATQAAWDEHGSNVTKITAALLKNTLVPGLAHRIETVTLANRAKARTWYEKLGLQFESTLRGYCADGSEAVRYVAVRDVENL